MYVYFARRIVVTAVVRNVAYGLNQPLINENQPPIVSTRNPTTADKALIGTLWVNTSNDDAFILTSIVANSANWASTTGGGGTFSSLTVTPGPISLTGTTTINTTGSATTSIGSTTGASGIALLVGTGNFSLNGAAGSTYAIGAATTTGTITIGGTAETGTITLGSSSGTNIVAIGAGAGATTVDIAGGIGGNTVNIANGAGANAVNIGTAASVNTVIIGSTNTTSTTTIQAGSGNIVLSGNLALSAAGPQVLFGAGDPNGSVTAPQGSLYLNTTGNSTSTRAFINSNSATTWIAVTTAS